MDGCAFVEWETHLQYCFDMQLSQLEKVDFKPSNSEVISRAASELIIDV